MIPLETDLDSNPVRWTWMQKLLFRFFFILLLLLMSDWWISFFRFIPYLSGAYYTLADSAVDAANKHLFHIRPTLVYPAGSGDTSYGWAWVCLMLLFSGAGSVIWSIIDRRTPHYQRLNYWLCLSVRYFIIMVSFRYGIDKMFLLQMGFPNLSQLATPLGDLLPMRLSWMFIGYSTSYQFFSGFMEMIVALLLLYRRTATLGVLMGLAVYLNVAALNLSYDIPVKIFSMGMVLANLFLLANEWKRIACFFLFNKPAATCLIYRFPFTSKWMRIGRWVVKIAFIILVPFTFTYSDWQDFKALNNTPESSPIRSGLYDVVTFAVNKDTLPPLITDTMRWQNLVFEKDGTGSVGSTDTTFRQRYRRGYFTSETDTVKHSISFRKLPGDSAMHKNVFLTMRYAIADSNTIQLWGKQHNDLLYVLLKRSNRHFQLKDRPFHWLSEYNR